MNRIDNEHDDENEDDWADRDGQPTRLPAVYLFALDNTLVLTSS
jgi:hypothetical protein